MPRRSDNNNNIDPNPKMKTKINYPKIFKAFLVAGLLAAPCLAFKAEAQANAVNDLWSPYHTFTDSSGNTFAYWNDPENWSLNIVPTIEDTNPADSTESYYTNFITAQFQQPATGGIYCVVTNDAECNQLMLGNGSAGQGGIIVVTNDATFETGFSGEWTGVGYPSGPGELIMGPGTSFTCGSHLWIGQGTPAPGVVIDNGGAMHIGGQLGVGWNGSGGTNYMYVTNGGNIYLNQWGGSTLGNKKSTADPTGSTTGSWGILDIGSGSSMVVTGFWTSVFAPYTNTAQLISYGGAGSLSWSFSSPNNLTTVVGVPPVDVNTPIFSAQPSNAVVSLGGTATFNALVSNVPVNYQWLFNGTTVQNGNGITGATTATLTIANLTAAEAGTYSVNATNSNPSYSSEFALSSSAQLTSQSFGLYPVVTLNGTVGNTYEVQYTSSLASPVTWTTLGTYTTISSPQYVPDFSAPLSTSRFYQVVQTGTAQ
jgi:Immunoglobulin domain